MEIQCQSIKHPFPWTFSSGTMARIGLGGASSAGEPWELLALLGQARIKWCWGCVVGDAVPSPASEHQAQPVARLPGNPPSCC